MAAYYSLGVATVMLAISLYGSLCFIVIALVCFRYIDFNKIT